MMNPRFGQGAVVVGLLPEQDPAVLKCAVDLAVATGAELVGAYVDPGSYLIEWDPDGNVLGKSLDRALDPDDEAALAVLELGPLLTAATEKHNVTASIRVLGGETALALGRLAEAVNASVIVVGARRPGLLAGVNEVLAGSVVRKLLATQHIPVLAIPRVDAHPPLHG
ncbi:Nucleotide-binding universal stress protein, UspA family [Arthrobacter alpinus]|uniref:Nucleotide-binding universal stress protein, UspA family n=1 Tax=Arthrobacter alpinus TaxID=656366 RepID=A0A1H5FTW6_9MICC|nr:universal stress protein [Arthrobacter alpinus]SEE06594.1 Nucleotide-binding universal stress protein, UspA family [Arthrobacter alpinus]